jgi:hypothetical protein
MNIPSPGKRHAGFREAAESRPLPLICIGFPQEGKWRRAVVIGDCRAFVVLLPHPFAAIIGRMRPFLRYNLLGHVICNNMAADGSLPRAAE